MRTRSPFDARAQYLLLVRRDLLRSSVDGCGGDRDRDRHREHSRHKHG